MPIPSPLLRESPGEFDDDDADNEEVKLEKSMLRCSIIA